MCGIIGHFSKSNQIDLNTFNVMRDTMTHRGPDGQGTVLLVGNHLAFGHRRLSIIDLSTNGHQPMSNADKSIWITFNGEIYNYQALRNKLIDLGLKFQSTSDTEVLINGYSAWGVEGLLNRIKGMFAFAIWDENSRKLVLARDRFGMKPLYYYHKNSQILFASEIKAIKQNNQLDFSINQQSIADYFIYSYVPNPYTIWNEVKKLPPAHYGIYDTLNDTFEIKRYWKLELGQTQISRQSAIEQANYLIKNAVKEHLVSDVPVGLFLSGGYDSTTLLMHCTREKTDPNTFSIGFHDSNRSEHKEARLIAQHYGSNHHDRILDIDQSYFKDLYDLSYYYDEPFAVSSMLPYYYVSKLASEYNKVVLAGDGGDEAFGGYVWNQTLWSEFNHTGWGARLKYLFKSKHQSFIERYNSFMTGILPACRNLNFLNPEIRKNITQRGLWLFEQFDIDLNDPMKSSQWLDFNTFIPEPCLTRADRSSMANSLEVRVPFLDHEIFEFIFSLNSRVYHDPARKKILVEENLRDAPPSVFSMPKRGFSFQHLNTIFDRQGVDVIENGRIKTNGVIETKQDINSLSALTKFHLLMLEFWFKHHAS